MLPKFSIVTVESEVWWSLHLFHNRLRLTRDTDLLVVFGILEPRLPIHLSLICSISPVTSFLFVIKISFLIAEYAFKDAGSVVFSHPGV